MTPLRRAHRVLRWIGTCGQMMPSAFWVHNRRGSGYSDRFETKTRVADNLFASEIEFLANLTISQIDELTRLRESDRLLRAIVKAYQGDSDRTIMRAIQKAQDALFPNQFKGAVDAILAAHKAQLKTKKREANP